MLVKENNLDQEVTDKCSTVHSLEEKGKCKPRVTDYDVTGRHVADFDRGYAWVIVAASFFVSSVMACNIMSFGIFIIEFRQTFGWTESDLGILGGLRLGLPTVACLFCGPLIERFGCRKLTISAILLSCVGHVISSFISNKVIFFLTFGLCAGVGAGLSLIPSIVIVQRYFSTRRAVAGALAASGLGFFSVLVSPLLRLLVAGIGWRGAVLLTGGANLQMIVAAALYRPPPVLNPPESSAVTGSDKHKALGYRKRLTRSIKSAFRYFFTKDIFNRKFVLYTVAQTTRMATLTSFYLRLAPIGVAIGLDPVRSSFLPSGVAICTTLFRAIAGFTASILLPNTIYCWFNMAASIIVLCVPFIPKVFWAYFVFAALYGLAVGMVFGIQDTCLVDIVGVSHLPKALSVCTFIIGGFTLVFNLIIGWLLDITGSYDIPLWVTAGIHFMGSLCGIGIIDWNKKD